MPVLRVRVYEFAEEACDERDADGDSPSEKCWNLCTVYAFFGDDPDEVHARAEQHAKFDSYYRAALAGRRFGGVLLRATPRWID